MGEELRDMLAVVDEAKVPSVFWNKEDPVHFERFIDSAKKCDVILTTDDQCVPRYIAESGKNRVDAMPFAAQPAIHNPLGSESRLNNPCFAGTYYGSRHQQRGADMMHLLKPAVDFDLHIYDRRYGYAGKDADQFRFPDIFQPCIQGKLAYDEMTRAYKRYRSFLNVNSVTTSQTMFSRRVFELLACGTPVISSYSAGIEHLLGDVVFISNSESETRAALETLSDDEAWAKVSLAGMRRVFAEHTYEHRLGFMFEKAGLKRPAARQASFIAMARVETAEQVARVRDHLDVQSFKPKAVFVISDSLAAEDLQSLSAAAGQAPVRHFTSQVELRDLAELLNTFTGAYIVRFDAGRGYGRHYLSDLKDALLYTQPAFFGRHSHYVTGDSDTLKLTNPGWEHRHATGAPGASVAARCGELSASSVRDVMFKTWFRVPDGRDLVSLSRYGFVDHHPDAPQVPLQHRPVRDALELG
jgi:spore maturation protein CgeB